MKKKIEFNVIDESKLDSLNLTTLTNDEMSDVLGANCIINIDPKQNR